MRKDQPEFRNPGSGDEMRDFDVPHDQPGSTFERAVIEVHRSRLPFYGSPDVQGVQFANGFAELAAVALARAEFYGKLLAEQVEREGIDGLIGEEIGGVAVGGEEKHLETFAKGEAVRALVALEAQERDRAAQLIEKGVRMGMEAKNVDAMRTYGRTVAEALRAMCEEFGITWTAEETRRAAQRAVLTARSRLGFENRPAAAAGPPLTIEERERVRRGQ